MKKPYGEFSTFTVKDIEVMIKKEYDEFISRILQGENMKIIKDLLEKRESNFVNLFADMYVATYRIQHELNNIQQIDYCGARAPVLRTLAPPDADNSPISAEDAPLFKSTI